MLKKNKFYVVDKKFLAFFFKRLKKNNTDRYKQFPYLSPCGRERNFVRCDDLPIVFTHIIKKTNSSNNQVENYFSYNHAQELLTVRYSNSVKKLPRKLNKIIPTLF